MDSNPRFGPQNLTAVLRDLKIIVGVIFFRHPSGVMTQTRGVDSGVLLSFICMMLQIRADLVTGVGTQRPCGLYSRLSLLSYRM